MRYYLLAGVMLALTVPAAAKAGEPSAARPIDPGSWVPADDYPSAALRIGAEGAVGVRVTVGPDGNPTKCDVAVSSDNADLDKASCDAVMLRARFAPATDKSGRPVAGSYSTRIVWKIPDGPRPLPPEYSLTITVVVDKDGSVASCDVKTTGDFPAQKDKLCADQPQLQPPVDANGRPVRKRITYTNSVHYEDLPDPPK